MIFFDYESNGKNEKKGQVFEKNSYSLMFFMAYFSSLESSISKVEMDTT